MPRLIVTPPKPCEVCRSPMFRPPRYPMARWAVRRWCSQDCMTKARAPTPVTCEFCGKTWKPKQMRARGIRFCSLRCNGMTLRTPESRPKQRYRWIWVNGKKVPEHRHVAEQMIGRKLLPNEAVHHKDENKRNNDPSNLQVMTDAEHSRLHMMQRLAIWPHGLRAAA